ncbi:MAG: hypothetical protein WCW40_07595 [Bacteroidota bacterium]
MPAHKQLLSVFADIIEGKTVKRAKHELNYEGRIVTETFIEALQQHHFLPVTVGETPIEPGQRIPAFYIEHHTAYFGWVFWEKFSQLRLRKLFGTVVRNAKGDWLIQLPSNSTKLIYADTSQIIEMDIDRPFEL